MVEFFAFCEGIVFMHFIVSGDVERLCRFYIEVFGGETVLEGELLIVVLANGWVIINVGGGLIEDKLMVTFEIFFDLDCMSSFLNIRVVDIQVVYVEWSWCGVEFFTLF